MFCDDSSCHLSLVSIVALTCKQTILTNINIVNYDLRVVTSDGRNIDNH